MTEAIQQFKLIDGGKDDTAELVPITKTAPKGPDGRDWLRDLNKGERFVCRGRNNRGCFLDYYGIAEIFPATIMLYNFLPIYGMSPFCWVDSLKFSQDHVLVEIIPNPFKEEGNNEHNLPASESREEHDGHEGPA